MGVIIGRLPNNATIEERLLKFSTILDFLNLEDIYLNEISNGNPVLSDNNCGFELTHNIITWEVFHISEVVKMIVDARDNFIERKKREGLNG